MTADTHEQIEWKAGYRDGLTAGLKVAETCAQDPTATPQSVVELLQALLSGHMFDALDQADPRRCQTTHPDNGQCEYGVHAVGWHLSGGEYWL